MPSSRTLSQLSASFSLSTHLLPFSFLLAQVVKYVEVEVPVEVVREIVKTIEVPVEVIVEKKVEVEKKVQVEVPVQVIREVPVEIIKEVPCKSCGCDDKGGSSKHPNRPDMINPIGGCQVTITLTTPLSSHYRRHHTPSLSRSHALLAHSSSHLLLLLCLPATGHRDAMHASHDAMHASHAAAASNGPASLRSSSRDGDRQLRVVPCNAAASVVRLPEPRARAYL